jgi:hypothetical protein
LRVADKLVWDFEKMQNAAHIGGVPGTDMGKTVGSGKAPQSAVKSDETGSDSAAATKPPGGSLEPGN